MKVASAYNTIPQLQSNSNSAIISQKCNIAYNTKKLWDDLKLLNRLIYRSNNQHKASFAFKHLKEIKRIAERIGKLELWLKENIVDQGQKVFDILGFSNTLRCLLDKALKACRKTFYFYAHYVDQALFVPLALVAIGVIGSVHSELMQWSKYLCIFHNSTIEKLRKQFGSAKVDEWCQINFIPKNIEIPNNSAPLPTIQKTETSQKRPIPPHSSAKKSQKFQKKDKRPLGNTKADEIDDIFNSL